MARRVFISFLGFTNYKECRYYKDDFCSESVRYIQEATLDYLLGKEIWSNNDVAYILLTDGAKTNNWLDNGHKVYGTSDSIIQEGLQTRLAKKHYPFQIKTVEQLPVGKNESELFEIFKRVYDVLEPGDKLYFDITHGFRSLPMLALVLVNYSKFLKGVEVKSITYGNFEVKEEIIDEEGKKHLKAPIIDLLPLSGIQDWTFAAADYIRNGNSKQIKKLITDHQAAVHKGLKSGSKDDANKLNYLANSLERIVNDFQTCRGLEILSGENVTKLRDNLSDYVDAVIEPLNPIILKVKESLSPFEGNSGKPNLKNGFEAARWCIEHNLYQQAATILQESIVSYFCIRYNLNYKDKDERSYVNTVFAFHKKTNDKETNESEKVEIISKIEKDSILRKLYFDPIMSSEKIYSAFGNLTDERNDINHSGMRDEKEAHTAKVIRENIQKAFNTFYKELI